MVLTPMYPTPELYLIDDQKGFSLIELLIRPEK
jgi:hypothetical protein